MSAHHLLEKDRRMHKSSLTALGRQQLELARATSTGRSASTVFGGHEHVLRQTVLALISGHRLDDHANPGEATVQVLLGHVSLHADGNAWSGRVGDLLVVPETLHSLQALEDSVVLLTIAKIR
jgi:quercetin dioxygenase-like cupin family protein